MKTVYVRRWTDDVREDQEEIRRENDAYLGDMRGLDGAIAKVWAGGTMNSSDQWQAEDAECSALT